MRRYYLVPSATTAAAGESAALDVLAQLMGGGSNSYLYRRLVIDRPLAVNAGAAYQGASLDATQFTISASPRPGVTFAQVEQVIDDVIADIGQNGVRSEDLERVKTQLIAETIYAQDNQATLARWYGGAMTTGLSIEDIRKLAGAHSRRHRRSGARCRAKMVRQEALGHRLSHQGCSAQARGEAVVTFPKIGTARLQLLLLGICMAMRDPGAFACRRQDPAPDFARRHRGLVCAGCHRPARRHGICHGWRRRAGPGRQGRRRQHGRRPHRRGLGRSGFTRISRTSRPARDRTELQRHAGLFPRLACACSRTTRTKPSTCCGCR